jgi:hypothetical protein
VHGRHAADAPALAHLDVEGVEGQEGVDALERATAEGFDDLVECGRG